MSGRGERGRVRWWIDVGGCWSSRLYLRALDEALGMALVGQGEHRSAARDDLVGAAVVH